MNLTTNNPIKKVRVIETELYQFEELSTEAQERAVEKQYDINLDYDWWDFFYEDMHIVDVSMRGFDLGRGESVSFDYDYDAETTAQLITENWGQGCDMYDTAWKFLQDYEIATTMVDLFHDLREDSVRMIGGEYADEYLYEAECKHEDKRQGLVDEFTKDLEHDALKRLRGEYEWRMSDEEIKQTLICNEYEFNIDGIRI